MRNTDLTLSLKIFQGILSHLHGNYKQDIAKGEPVIEISSDASSFGWGAVCNNIRTRGTFNLDKMEYHINAKERLAAKFSEKTFVKVSDAHVKLLSDNTTTVHDINNIHSDKCELYHSIISEIWAWSKDKKRLNSCFLYSRKEKL